MGRVINWLTKVIGLIWSLFCGKSNPTASSRVLGNTCSQSSRVSVSLCASVKPQVCGFSFRDLLPLPQPSTVFFDSYRVIFFITPIQILPPIVSHPTTAVPSCQVPSFYSLLHAKKFLWKNDNFLFTRVPCECILLIKRHEGCWWNLFDDLLIPQISPDSSYASAGYVNFRAPFIVFANICAGRKYVEICVC